MYKKITHSIVEEHFAHPLAAELKKKVEKAKLEMATPVTATKLELDIHKAVSNLFWGVRRYLIDALGSHDDATAAVKTKLLADISSFAPLFTAYFPANVGTAIVAHLTGLAAAYVDMVTAAKSGKDITALRAAAQTHVDQLVSSISTANPTKWPASTVKAFLDEYLNLITTQLTSRVKKEWKSDMAAESHALNLMLNGPIMYDGALKGLPDFAAVVASGFPAK